MRRRVTEELISQVHCCEGLKTRNFQNAFHFSTLSTMHERKPTDVPPLQGKEVAL